MTDHMFQETCADIRATDEISFKLMGVVPLVSGASFLALFLKDPISTNAPVVFCLALYAALITLGLFRWELRNIQTCSWLRRRREALEKTKQPGAPLLIDERIGELRVGDRRIGDLRIGKLRIGDLRIGKTEAEKLIYSVTILAWLSIPPLLCPLHNFTWLLLAYIPAATLVVAATALTVLAKVKFPEMTIGTEVASSA